MKCSEGTRLSARIRSATRWALGGMTSPGPSDYPAGIIHHCAVSEGCRRPAACPSLPRKRHTCLCHFSQVVNHASCSRTGQVTLPPRRACPPPPQPLGLHRPPVWPPRCPCRPSPTHSFARRRSAGTLGKGQRERLVIS